MEVTSVIKRTDGGYDIWIDGLLTARAFPDVDVYVRAKQLDEALKETTDYREGFIKGYQDATPIEGKNSFYNQGWKDGRKKEIDAEYTRITK